MTEIIDHPVFICGHPKSGTSLLRNLLDSHPQLVVYPEESRFFRHFLPLAENASENDWSDLAKQHLIHIFQWNRDHPPAHQAGFEDREYGWIPYADVERKLIARIEKEGVRHPGDFLSAAILAFGEATGLSDADPKWWVEKTPYNEYFAHQIFDWWPLARCIHVVRDPCDNYASYRRKQTDWSPEFFATNWVNSTQAGLENQKKYGAQRYWILRFEDLVRQPEDFLYDLLAFLAIEDQPVLRTPTRAGRDWGGNSMFDQTFSGISTTPVGRGQAELNVTETAVIQSITKRTAEAIGYPADAPKPFPAIVRAWLWQVRMAFYRFRRRIRTGGMGL